MLFHTLRGTCGSKSGVSPCGVCAVEDLFVPCCHVGKQQRISSHTCDEADSHESTESVEDLFMSPNRANSFITPQRGNAYNVPVRGSSFNYYNFMRTIKSPAERRAETCEDYSPCRFYAYRHGYQQAYRRYFGNQNPPQKQAGARRY
ncbi:hypothetical protein LDENG_00232630 [Lucifuga dentata]|nr:hypothetical protein LDENG_00232630 [Lucifuga dentata]